MQALDPQQKKNTDGLISYVNCTAMLSMFKNINAKFLGLVFQNYFDLETAGNLHVKSMQTKNIDFVFTFVLREERKAHTPS